MSNLKHWREALQIDSQKENRFYHSEMMDLLRAGESAVERLHSKMRTIEILTRGSREVAGIHYLAESALVDLENE